MSNKAPKVKVLYQNLGGTWYAFTELNESVFFGKVPLLTSAKGASERTNKKEVAKRKAQKTPEV